MEEIKRLKPENFEISVKYFKGQNFSISLIAESVKHILTHQRLIIDFYQVDFSKSSDELQNFSKKTLFIKKTLQK